MSLTFTYTDGEVRVTIVEYNVQLAAMYIIDGRSDDYIRMILRSASVPPRETDCTIRIAHQRLEE